MPIDYDRFCVDPDPFLDELLERLNMSISSEKRQKIIQLMNIPSAIGRHKNHNLEQFSDEQIEAVASFGFDIARQTE